MYCNEFIFYCIFLCFINFLKKLFKIFMKFIIFSYLWLEYKKNSWEKFQSNYHYHHVDSIDFLDSLYPSIQVLQTIFSVCRADVSNFLFVSQHRYVHMERSIEECHLWVCPCFSGGIPHVLFIWEVKQLFCKVLLPEFVQNSMQHFCVVPIWLFLYAFC